ncbi:MAG: hypothetical protein ACJAW8_002074 [Oleispira sp.]
MPIKAHRTHLGRKIRMITLIELTEFLGWASLLNLGMLSFASLLLVLMRPYITAIHSKLLSIPETELSTIYMNYLANYKILTFVFMVMPYLALKIMGQ